MQITTIGLDIAKNVFQVHGVNGQGQAVLRRKVSPKGALLGHKLPKADLKDVQRIYEKVEDAEDGGYELNLYISGYDEDDEGPGEVGPAAASAAAAPDQGQPGQEPEDSPTR